MSEQKPTDAEVLERLIALDGLLNMHERAQAADVPCKLNGESRKLNMEVIDCGTSACLHGSATLSPWFKERGYIEVREDDSLRTAIERFFGKAGASVYQLYGMESSTMNVCWEGPYEGKLLSDLTVADVRPILRKIILEHGGEKAIQTCEANKLRGDKLRMGIA